MHIRNQNTAIFVLTMILLAGCAPQSPPALIPTVADSTATAEATFTATEIPPATLAPTATELPIETYIAYVQNDALLVTHVMAGQSLETWQLIESPEKGGIFNLGWSPSGEYLSFSMFVTPIEYHLFIVKAIEGSTPIDIGDYANDRAWSPDSTLLAYERYYDLWVYSPNSGQSRRLTSHLGVRWVWGTLAFTPAGDALVAAGTVTYTDFKLYRVPLDGSAANAYPTTDMPSLTSEIAGRPPLALRFSPDGQKLAFISSENVNACAELAQAGFVYSPVVTHYFVANPDGSDLHELPVVSLAAVSDPDQKLYFFGDSLVWMPGSEGLWLFGLVRDCGTFANTMVGGPQISRVTLDGQEHEIFPGFYSNLSLDRTGNLLGVVNRNTITLGEVVPRVQILGLDGHLILDLGEGDRAVLQP